MIVVRIPNGASVLLLEDSLERVRWFRERIPSLDHVTTACEAIENFSSGKVYDFVFLDHDLGLLDLRGKPGREGTGLRVARYMTALGFTGKNVLIHSWNPSGAVAMKDALQGAFVVPFGQFEIERI